MTQDKELIVDPTDESCFATLNEALEDAMDGERITVRPGEYRENLVIDKQVQIIGEGSVEDIRVIGDGVSAVITAQSPLLLVRNLTLVNSSGKIATVSCESGICDIKFCTLTGGNYGASGLPGSRMSVEDCAIAGCVSGGVYGQECTALTVADTLIEKCSGSGVIAEECTQVIVERCTIMEVGPHAVTCQGGEIFEVKDTEISGVSDAPILDDGEAITMDLDRLWYERKLSEDEDE